MSVSKRPGAEVYSYDFQFRGHRFHGSTGCKERREVERFERGERMRIGAERTTATKVMAFGVVATLLATFGAVAQEPSTPSPITLSIAMDTLPDHTRYRVELAPSDMPQDRMRTLAQMVGDAARGQHFYGAIYGYRPSAGGTTEYKMRSKLHSREAARRGALADCDAARLPDDTECTLIGEILPEGWSAGMPQLSHVAVQAIRETAGQLPGNVVIARSRDGDAFEIRAGDDVRDATLNACNGLNAAAGLPRDCEIVVDDLASD